LFGKCVLQLVKQCMIETCHYQILSCRKDKYRDQHHNSAFKLANNNEDRYHNIVSRLVMVLEISIIILFQVG
jgi:hypothetical protein